MNTALVASFLVDYSNMLDDQYIEGKLKEDVYEKIEFSNIAIVDGSYRVSNPTLSRVKLYSFSKTDQ